MIASLVLAAALLAPGAARLPAHSPATIVARVMAVCAAVSMSEAAHRRSTNVGRSMRVIASVASISRYVPLVVTTQLRR
jgi:ABC-type amino acid transport system permease subunit